VISLACYLPPCPKPTCQAVSCWVDPTSLALVSDQHPLDPIPPPQTWKSVDSSDNDKVTVMKLNQQKKRSSKRIWTSNVAILIFQ